jgi:adenylosuccinate lyase
MKSYNNLSPLDSRYAEKVQPITNIFSEYNYYKTCCIIEIQWAVWLYYYQEEKEEFSIETLNKIDNAVDILINHIEDDFIDEIKRLELTTKHDIKAVEKYVVKLISNTKFVSCVHFCLTSQDIVSLAYNVLVKNANDIIEESLENLGKSLENLANCAGSFQKFPALTHGQKGVLTTFNHHLRTYKKRLEEVCAGKPLSIKFGGAIGDLQSIQNFVDELNPLGAINKFLTFFYKEEKFKIDYSVTQVDNHKNICETLKRYTDICNIMIDLNRDLWTYVSMSYFIHSSETGQTGSSTMPNKVNPINFENSEGSAEFASNLFTFFINKFPKSRMYRDLTDSFTIRNLGYSVGCFYLSLNSILEGISKLSINESELKQVTEVSWECCAEYMQLLLKKNKIENAYEMILDVLKGRKDLTRGDMKFLVMNKLDIPYNLKVELIEKLTVYMRS